ncbi:MAG: UDP-N-acetyl-D-galactosamine dehydrogenase [Alphaproteobacteria bacterium]|nr:UDP-N-acetyl-D-galactosamine dehydrogenase [Alphaproteobacteria bacterium]
MNIKDCRIGVIGLGYVGMPLAVRLSKYMPTVGFDISEARVNELREGWDRNREIRQSDLRGTTCRFSFDTSDLKDCNVLIVTVPTPLDENNDPDLGPVRAATKMLAAQLKKGDIVVYESTVYPGVTEDICGTLLEKESGLKCGKDFFLGYSPERINPGDAEHTLEHITKVVSGQTDEVTDLLAEIYGLVNNNNIFKARDIRTAEASKAIENAQRDINVAFINEVTMILNKLGLSSYDVIEAAQTKWNFLPFTPGLVGGHCIGVDPYYLAHCATEIGHEPKVILSGRQINDSMGQFVADALASSVEGVENPRILLLGFTFKENINDIRNTKVIDICNALKAKGISVDIHDPHAIPDEVKHEYGIEILAKLPSSENYDCIALTVGHKIYKDLNANQIAALIKDEGVLYDLKGIWRKQNLDGNFHYKTL